MFELIENLMKNKNISLNELTKNTSVSQQQFNNWKAKKSKPSSEALNELATFFDVPISYFFGKGLVEEKSGFSDSDLILARELNKTDKLELIKDIMRIKEQADVQIIKLMTEKILKTQGK